MLDEERAVCKHHAVKSLRSKIHHAQRVLEPRVHRARVHVVRERELADVPQSLELRAVYDGLLGFGVPNKALHGAANALDG